MYSMMTRYVSLSVGLDSDDYLYIYSPAQLALVVFGWLPDNPAQ